MNNRFRIIVRIDDAGMACNVGGAVQSIFKTVEITSPELARALTISATLAHAQVVGVEQIEEPTP